MLEKQYIAKRERNIETVYIRQFFKERKSQSYIGTFKDGVYALNHHDEIPNGVRSELALVYYLLALN